MRKLALVVALALLVLAVLWLATSDPQSSQAAADPAASAKVAPTPSDSSASSSPAPLEVAPTPSAQESVRESTREEASAPAPAAPGVNDCAAFGRVVDERGQPLSGLVVRLAAFKSWSTRAEAPRLPGPREFMGFETTTDATGAFRFEVPTPTSEFVELSIKPEIYRDSLSVRFTARDPRARAPLIAGDNDLGVFELVATGAIEGYVRDSRGAPIEGAKLTLAQQPYSTLGRDAVSDASGHYILGHVAPGEFGVNCQALERLSQFRKPIAVEALRTTSGIDFVLADAPTLRGFVVDEAGASIGGAKIWCWPSTSGMGAGATSELDGGFTVYLPQDEPYTLECKRDGFEPFGVGNRDRTYPQGTADIQVVMRAAGRTRFRVVDSRGGAPIERFGIALYRENFSQPPRATPRDYPGGEVELAATSALDKVAIRAPGFQLYAAPVQHDAPGDRLQTVRLEPANSVRGRVLREGQPAAGAQAVLEQGRHEIRFEGGEVSVVKGSFQVTGADRRSVRCDGEGRFVFEGLDNGLCRVIAEDGSGALAVSSVLNLSGGREVDLGDLSLGQGGVVLGRVLVPPGRALEDVEIELDGPIAGRKVRTDPGGAFRFEGVRPGEHQLRALERAGQHMASERVTFELADGATHELELDLSGLGVGRVSLTVTLNGDPLPNAEVSIVPLAVSAPFTQLGKTDASGRVTGWARALGPSTVEIRSARHITLRHHERVLDVALDSTVDERVDFAATTLTVLLPAGVSWPEQGRAQLTFLGRDDRSLGDGQLFINEGELVAGGVAFDRAGASVELDFVPLHAVALEFALNGPTRIERSAADPNVSTHRAETLLQTRAALQLTAGARNVVQLR